MPEILIVDDDRAVRAGLRAVLKREGYSVRSARRADEALAAFAEKRPDLVLLDVMMPGRSGFSACEEIRRSDPLVPVVFLTAKDDESDHVRAFGLGADDYVSKATGEGEFLARVRRALDRAAAFRAAATEPRRVAFGAVTVDFDALTASGGGVDARLTKTEADLLWLLNAERGRLYTYDDILDVLRGGDLTSYASVQTHVSRLKRKLGGAGELVFNERGLGYKLLA